MALASQAVVEKITALAEQIGDPQGLEIVEVDLLGGGIHRVLRIYIDKPEGVTHEDCALLSRQLSESLDVGDVIPGGAYTLEVSSPGVDRKLSKLKDFERFKGQKIKLSLKAPVDGEKRYEGVLEEFESGVLTLSVKQGKKEPKLVRIEFEQVDKANLKFEW